MSPRQRLSLFSHGIRHIVPPYRGFRLSSEVMIDADKVRAAMAGHDEIQIAFVFGSVARNSEGPGSDLDIGVAAAAPVTAEQKLALMDALAMAFGRPVDIVDLSTAPVPVLRQALTTGVCILKKDINLYANLLRKLWYDQADLMPNYEMILRRRRERFAQCIDKVLRDDPGS